MPLQDADNKEGITQQIGDKSCITKVGNTQGDTTDILQANFFNIELTGRFQQMLRIAKLPLATWLYLKIYNNAVKIRLT